MPPFDAAAKLLEIIETTAPASMPPAMRSLVTPYVRAAVIDAWQAAGVLAEGEGEVLRAGPLEPPRLLANLAAATPGDAELTSPDRLQGVLPALHAIASLAGVAVPRIQLVSLEVFTTFAQLNYLTSDHDRLEPRPSWVLRTPHVAVDARHVRTLQLAQGASRHEAEFTLDGTPDPSGWELAWIVGADSGVVRPFARDVPESR